MWPSRLRVALEAAVLGGRARVEQRHVGRRRAGRGRRPSSGASGSGRGREATRRPGLTAAFEIGRPSSTQPGSRRRGSAPTRRRTPAGSTRPGRRTGSGCRRRPRPSSRRRSRPRRARRPSAPGPTSRSASPRVVGVDRGRSASRGRRRPGCGRPRRRRPAAVGPPAGVEDPDARAVPAVPRASRSWRGARVGPGRTHRRYHTAVVAPFSPDAGTAGGRPRGAARARRRHLPEHRLRRPDPGRDRRARWPTSRQWELRTGRAHVDCLGGVPPAHGRGARGRRRGPHDRPDAIALTHSTTDGMNAIAAAARLAARRPGGHDRPRARRRRSAPCTRSATASGVELVARRHRRRRRRRAGRSRRSRPRSRRGPGSSSPPTSPGRPGPSCRSADRWPTSPTRAAP